MYKIGDTVKIKKDLKSGDLVDGFPFPETILNDGVDVFEITDIDRGFVKVNGFWLINGMVEPLKPNILDMKAYQKAKMLMLKREVERLKNAGIEPVLNILTDGESKAAETYMKSKIKQASAIGINVNKIVLKDEYDARDFVWNYSNYDTPTICQFPIKDSIKSIYMNNVIDFLDADGFNSYRSLYSGDYSIAPATAKGIYEHLLFSGKEIKGANVVILGRGELVGKPLSIMLINDGATVTVINSKTDDTFKRLVLKEADVVVAATGVLGSVKTSELSDTKEVFVYNVGICFDENKKLTTECVCDEYKENVFMTDRIGAVGVCTCLNLFDNVLNFY